MNTSSYHQGVWYSILQHQSHQGQRGGNTSSSCTCDSADVMTTQTSCENSKPAADVAVTPIIIAATVNNRGLPELSQLSQAGRFNVQESHLID
ncbi:hypothetical protein RRG08_030241 [Elysia crispata]|uniref:Uncharacterized protein n=1 Tax=Elysia crispata TaxID=231223 RepID=A0AAE1AIL1_9GAST|nr:hypothetical protein RRG08_030241 [Elysia crispata]